MIVKDEEKVLRRCLDSVKDIVDEIVIVDTGSTDRTRNIAEEYTDKIYSYEWNDSFADARNFAQSNATGEWILVLDADEYVDRENLKKAVNDIKSETRCFDCYEVRIYNFTGAYGERIVQNKSIRIYKNNNNMYYYRSIHEQLAKKDKEQITGSLSLFIYHSGYLNVTVKEKKKGNRNIALLNKEIESTGNKGFDYFNLGNELLSKGDSQKALEAYLDAYKNKPDYRYSWVSFCIVQIVNCLIKLKRYQDALSVIGDAENLYAKSPDFKCLRGSIYFMQNRYDDSAEVMNEIVNNKDYYEYCISSPDFLEYFPHQVLSKIYSYQGEYEKSVYHSIKVLEINKADYQNLFNLIKVLSRYCSENEIYSFITDHKIVTSDKDLYNIIKIMLSLYQINNADKFINMINDEQRKAKMGLSLKCSLFKGDFQMLSDFIESGSLEQLVEMLKNDYLDIFDLYVYSLINDKKNLLILLYDLVSESKQKDFIRFLLHSSDTKVVDTNSYIMLLEKSLQMRQYDLPEKLVTSDTQLEPSINISIGNLIYNYEFVDLALDFYQRTDIKYFDDQSFVNIIENLLSRGRYDDALQFGLVAIDQKHFDYRIFKSVIEILNIKKMENEMRGFIFEAQKHYPDSNWLKNISRQ